MLTHAETCLAQWGLEGHLTPLQGYDSENYKVECPDGRRFVLKITSDSNTGHLWRGENAMLEHLASESTATTYPNLVPIPETGELMARFEEKDHTRFARLLTWVDGTFYAEAEVSETLWENFGSFMGETDRKLSSLQNETIQAFKHPWDLQHLPDIAIHLKHIARPEDRRLVDYFLLQIEENLARHYRVLPWQILHNDFNNWNVLVQDEGRIGVIDFGDACYTARIHELGVAIAYASMDVDSPLDTAALVAKGYAGSFELTPLECDVLYYSVAARLCQSVLMSAYSKHLKPDNEYITISERPAWNLLHRWIAVNPKAASDAFRKAAGHEVLQSTTAQERLAARNEHISKGMSTSYQHPIAMDSAGLQYMHGSDRKTYLDAYNNIIHVGHCHPKVVRAAQRQLARMNTNTRYLYDVHAEYAERLSNLFPDSLNKVFFVNSGSAASDLAIRLAQTHSKANDLMVMEHGYHGNTRLGIAMSHYKFAGKGGAGADHHVHVAPMPDTYRGPIKAREENAGAQYAEQAIHILSEAKEKVAAFIAEPIIGCGGQVPLPPGYLAPIYEAVRAQGGVCISDEVQVGFGRLGKHFWGYEMQNVVPDIVVLGKPIGNGHPLAAVVTTDAIAASFENGMEFFSSFGGNPVSCATGLAVLDVIAEEKLQENALETGAYLKAGLKALAENFPVIGDVRGEGLFIGIELIEDPITLTPATDFTRDLVNRVKEAGILISSDGPYNNVIKIKPPITFDKSHADHLLHTLAMELRRP